MDATSKFINRVLQNRPNLPRPSFSKPSFGRKKKKKNKSQQQYQSTESLMSTMEEEEEGAKGGNSTMTDVTDGAATSSTDKTKEAAVVEEDVDIGPTDNMTEERRNELFEKGVKYDREKKRDAALKCYLGCLQGLQHDTRFPLLPVCLRNIADIFYQKEEYDKAIHFVQAEKVYYESALIDTESIHKKIEDIKKTKNLTTDVTEETIKADEYEELARALLEKKQPKMALEYAGKATKIRQEVLGDSHETTKRSLDFFATVYAEAGAEQYQDSMNKFSSQASVDDSIVSSEGEGGTSPKPILRNRKTATGESPVKKQVSFDEAQLLNFEKQEREEKCAKFILWLLFIICFTLLLILGTYLYCHTTRTTTCATFRTYLEYIRVYIEESQKRLRFYWYKRFSSNDVQYG